MVHMSRILWVLLSVLGAVALAHIVGVVNPDEKVNGLWLVVAAACIQPAMFMAVRCEIAKSRCETGTRSREGERHPCNRLLTD